MASMMDQIISLPVIPHFAVLLFAYLLALPIGWNREKEERSAGLRTFPLVAVATCGVVQPTETILKGDAEGTSNDHQRGERLARGPDQRHGLHWRRRDPENGGFGARHGDGGEPLGDRRDRSCGRIGLL